MDHPEPSSAPARFVFAYGSLLSPSSLAATLPGIDLTDCVPSRLRGFERRLGVAFPNDGREHDKAYLDARGARPPRVLFWDVVRRPGATVNGVCIPVGDRELAALQRRELRYDLVELPGVEPYADWSLPARATVLGFLGRATYTQPADVDAGLVARSYLDETARGVQHWDERIPGFRADFQAGTAAMPTERIVDLRRVDAAAGP